jgi:glycosyltransferase involved in cell wall biosynthesis
VNTWTNVIEYRHITVVAPVLNEERSIGLFLNSLKHQTLQPYEVIFIDGNSTDRTLDIIDSYRHDLNIVVLTDATRNIGYIRNVGAKEVISTIMFHTNSDAFFPPTLLDSLQFEMLLNKHLMCITGRTYSFGAGVGSKIAYGAFDTMRWILMNAPKAIRKVSPSGNFLAITSDEFKAIKGFPEVKINEDGILGERITEYSAAHNLKVKFMMSLWAGHNAKRFNQGTLKTLKFYSYVFGNFSPLLKKVFAHTENESAKVFANR